MEGYEVPVGAHFIEFSIMSASDCCACGAEGAAKLHAAGQGDCKMSKGLCWLGPAQLQREHTWLGGQWQSTNAKATCLAVPDLVQYVTHTRTCPEGQGQG